MRQVFFYPARGVDEVYGVVVVFFYTGGDGKNIWVEDNILWSEADFVDKYVIRAFADFNLALKGIGLTFFIKGHDDRRSAIFFY